MTEANVRPVLAAKPGWTRREAERFIEQAFVNEIAAKSALLVIHRVVRASALAATGKPETLEQAMVKLVKYAEGHPLPADWEKFL